MAAHKHQFIFIEQVSRRPKDATMPRVVEQFGTRAGCMDCGEIRIIWANGEIVIEATKDDIVSSKN